MRTQTRRCPRCTITLEAHRFTLIDRGLRRCPSCGLRSPGYRFVAVTDKRRVSYAGLN
jgi:hypothetical protein